MKKETKKTDDEIYFTVGCMEGVGMGINGINDPKKNIFCSDLSDKEATEKRVEVKISKGQLKDVFETLLGVDAKSSRPIKTIIDNTNTSYDVDRLFILAFSKCQDFSSKDNMADNFHKHIPEFKNMQIRELFRIINGMINKINELECKKES